MSNLNQLTVRFEKPMAYNFCNSTSWSIVPKAIDNLGHNILGLYNVLAQIRLTTSKKNMRASIVNLVYELPNELLDDLRS